MLERAQRTAESLCRLVACQPLQIAQQQGATVAFGQASELFVEHELRFADGQFVQDVARRAFMGTSLASTSTLSLLACLQGKATRYSKEPWPDRILGAEATSLAAQNQKDCLEYVLGFMFVAKHTPAHAQHHGPVTANENRKGRFILLVREALDEFTIR
jgi:hypothetical protein